jgi:hypothetical protein
VPRAYDILRPTKEWNGEQIKIKKLKIGKFNTKLNSKTIFKTQNSTISLPLKWEVCENSISQTLSS